MYRSNEHTFQFEAKHQTNYRPHLHIDFLLRLVLSSNRYVEQYISQIVVIVLLLQNEGKKHTPSIALRYIKIIPESRDIQRFKIKLINFC